MDFPCTSCGACCRRVYMSHEGLFPQEWVKEDGSCIHLTKENRCAIYETRPEYCRINYFAGEFGMSEKEYHLLNAKICNQWMAEDDIFDKFIPLTLFETE